MSERKILIQVNTGKSYLVKDLDDDFYTNEGIVTKEQLNSEDDVITTDKGKKFFLLNPSLTDYLENLERGPQIMKSKDVGMIIAKTGINHKSRIVDAGFGTGFMSLTLANLGAEVVAYEINPQHIKIAEKNIKLIGLKNITLKSKSIYDGIEEDNLDLIHLDLAEPWKVIRDAEEKLKHGGYLAVYMPNINQTKTFIDHTKRTKIKVLETIELLERSWMIEENVIRPDFKMLGHTGFITFCRKL